MCIDIKYVFIVIFYVNLVFLITQIMKLYESSSKVDIKVCFPEFACA